MAGIARSGKEHAVYPLDEILLPMNASAVDDERRMEEIWKGPDYVAEEKYDGSRYLAIGGRFFSRRIGVGGYPVEKTDRVPHLAALAEFPNLILDGELYVPGGNSSDVTSILGSLPERAVELQKEQGHLCYVIFDVLRDIDGKWLLDRPYHERRKYLEAVHAKLGNPHVNLSTVVVEDKRSFFEEILARGGEGVILKYVHGLYIPGNARPGTGSRRKST